MKIIWLVGKYNSGEGAHCAWELSGLFRTEDEAVSAAMLRGDRHFVAPVEIGVLFPEEPIAFHGAYYPSHQTAP